MSLSGLTSKRGDTTSSTWSQPQGIQEYLIKFSLKIIVFEIKKKSIYGNNRYNFWKDCDCQHLNDLKMDVFTESQVLVAE